MFSFLIYPLIVLVIFVFGIRAIFHAFRKNRKADASYNEKNLFFSKDDGFSQIFFFISLFFFYLFLYNFNKSVGAPFSIQTIFFICSILTFLISYMSKSIFLLPFGIVGLYASLALYINDWIPSGNGALFASVVILILFSIFMYTVGRLHELDLRWKRFGLAYVVIGLLPIGGFLFYFSSYSGLDLLESVSSTFIYSSWEIATLALFLFLLIVISFGYGISKKVIRSYETISGAIFTIIVLLLSFIQAKDLFVSHASYYGTADILTGAGILWLFIFNVLLFVFISGFIVLGYFRRESWAINLGAGLFVLFFIVKYIQFLVDSLSKSLLFIVGGILLLVIGYILSQGRKKLLDSIKTDSVATTP